MGTTPHCTITAYGTRHSTLVCPQGALGTRRAASMGATPSIEDFVTNWAGEINVASRWEPPKYHSKALVEFHGTLLFFLREGTVPRRHINWQQYRPNAVPDKSSNPKRQRRNERKATLAEQVKTLVHTYPWEGCAAVQQETH